MYISAIKPSLPWINLAIFALHPKFIAMVFITLKDISNSSLEIPKVLPLSSTPIS